VAWNRQHVSGPVTGEDPLDWSVAAMLDATSRLLRARGWGRPHAFAAITEAVWWVTMVDATLVRYHPDAYNSVLDGHDPGQRTVIEDTFGGLRFVRNRMGYEADHEDFIQPPPRGRARQPAVPIADWTWRQVDQPQLTCLPPQRREWELSRYRCYQSQLAGHRIGDTFGTAAAFLRLATEGSVSRS
jgi:hypothetical protein